ncbi:MULTISPECIES: type I secretion system permease/ATPase [unclassified Janthinobacterium]|uniref:type I secretion system permease/ATPase n=1 Tax=unclassified Janthinobacterium TaxID=2610881 RepID=UPI00034BE31E|nr:MULTISPECIES: type I secretion system permease/ATPase [unclassified Janthinobacterium]MEC5161082.1 ATP-binding cassette subfamily C protein LapB [Janthinobacterium sp. CG_S6]
MMPSPQPASAAGAVAVCEAVVFLSRFFGAAVQHERLRASLAAFDAAGADGALDEALAHAGLVGTALATGAARRPTEMPALLLNDAGQALVVLAIDAGKYQCHVPGIDGSCWLDAAALAGEVPAGRWVAVRPLMYFDQRSLLYSLPVNGRWFWDVFNRNRWVFRWALLGTLVLNVIGALVPFYAMAVYDRVIPNNATASLAVLTVAAVALTGFELAMRLLRGELVETASRRIDVALSASIFAQCLRLRAASRPASGGALANTVRDFESVREFFASSTLTALGDVPFLLLFLGVIALVGGWLALVPLAAIPILLLVALAAKRPLARHVAASMQESGQRTAHLFESMNGLDTIKALGAEAWSRRKWEGLTVAIAANSVETREIVSRVNYINTAVLALAGTAVVAVGALLMGEKLLTLGQVIAVSMLTGRALAPVSQIAGLIMRWEQTKLSYEALNKIMQAPTDDDGASLQAPPLSGRIEFRDVGFAYPQSAPLLEKLNLTIAPGQRVGVIGKLGSGKSTLLRLLLNQYGPSSGGVLFDDLASTQLDPLSLRRQIGYVPQDVTLFHGTLRENIELGRSQADDAGLLEAIRLACLDDIVSQLPQGVATEVGERGERLSGGQRQAVAMARALLAKPPILLLDEPSSMFDPATEQRLIGRLRSLRDTTIVLVTHRMAMLALVDRLIVFDRGRIVADGPRDEILRVLAAQPGAAAAPAISPEVSA